MGLCCSRPTKRWPTKRILARIEAIKKAENRAASDTLLPDIILETSLYPNTGTPIMITVGMNYHVIPGMQKSFEDKFAGVIDALKAAPGHTSSTLWKDVSDDASYLITSEWSEESAFQEFIRSEAFRAVTNWGKEQILSGRPQHKVYKH
jgi:heme-degrading monooxygenase HmoA